MTSRTAIRQPAIVKNRLWRTLVARTENLIRPPISYDQKTTFNGILVGCFVMSYSAKSYLHSR